MKKVHTICVSLLHEHFMSLVWWYEFLIRIFHPFLSAPDSISTVSSLSQLPLRKTFSTAFRRVRETGAANCVISIMKFVSRKIHDLSPEIKNQNGCHVMAKYQVKVNFEKKFSSMKSRVYFYKREVVSVAII